MSLQKIQAKLSFRAACLRAVREFFSIRKYCEVMTPIASKEVIIDAHISPWQVSSGVNTGQRHFLHTSPEMHHKRLLAQGMNSLYEIAHVFRADERGSKHHPEFLMLEWYGVKTDHEQQMELVEELVREVWNVANVWHTQNKFPGTEERLSPLKFRRVSYYELFHKVWKINPHKTSIAELSEIAKSWKIGVPCSGMNEVDDWLNLLLTEYLEPQVLAVEPVFLFDYPVSQAALARVIKDEHQNQVASRFELYLKGVELCNGYHEQQNGKELESRMQAQNKLREKQGQAPLPY